jgi:hypothetical protein
MLGASGTVCPTTTVAVAGAIWKLVIAGGGACTVRAAVTVPPVLTLAVMLALPGDTPVATQEAPLTAAVAIAVLELTHEVGETAVPDADTV